MPYNEFMEFVETSLFSNSDETLSFYAQVRRFIFHFISVNSKKTTNIASSNKLDIINTVKWYFCPTKEQGLYFQ